MVTRPLLALAEATQEISRGRLDYRVDVQVGQRNRTTGELVQPDGGGPGGQPRQH